MKKTIITLSAIFFSFLVMAQKNSTKKDYNFFNDGHSYWTIDATFGVIAGWDEQAYTDNNILYTEKIGDQVNVGLTIGATKTFESNFYASTSVAFSVAKETGLWDNPLNYLAINLDGGYKFKTGTFFVPFLALGGSYINAPNTIANSNSSIAFTPSAGFNMWFKNSSLGFTTKFGYRLVSNEFMETHKYLTVGLIKKF